MSTSPKAFVWYELMTTDMDAAAASTAPWSAGMRRTGEPGTYTLMSAGDMMVAGLDARRR